MVVFWDFVCLCEVVYVLIGVFSCWFGWWFIINVLYWLEIGVGEFL